MTSSKESIIRKIKNANRPAVPLPDMSVTAEFDDGNTYEQRLESIKQKAAAMHILLLEADSLADVKALIAQHYSGVEHLFCSVGGIDAGNMTLSDLSKNTQLNKLGLAVLQGQFIVAENVAVWITDVEIPLRSVITATESLMLIVPKENVVGNMHNAYNRIDLSATGYGMFICGPSKTADIEQTLVIGAHGAKTMAVVLI